jgi:hypothetical protein
MASIPTTKLAGDRTTPIGSSLTVSSYERAATLVISMLVIFGTLFGALAMVFFADKFSAEVIEPISFVPMEASSPSGNGGISDDPDPPGVEDAPELSEPGLQDTLAAIETTTAAFSDALVSDTAIQGTAEQAGRGSGLGDARQPGPGGDGVIERVPRWERWKIRFEPKSAGEFARWLDQFKIRIGVLGRDNKVHVAWDFTKPNAQVASVDPKEYNGWGQTLPADGPMPALTANLARKAGTFGRGPIVLLFYPMEVEALLYNLEKDKNQSGDANKVRETVFTVVPQTDGYKFEVVSQKYF